MFFTWKIKCQLEVTGPLVWLSVDWGEWGAGVVGCMFTVAVAVSIWIDVEEETATSNNWIGCNFKPFRGQTFMTITKNNESCDPQPPHLQNWIIYIFFHSKSNCRGTLELHVDNLILILLHCHSIVCEDLKLYYFLDQVIQNYIFFRFFIFFYIWRSFARPQIKTLIVKFRLLSKKTSNPMFFFH